MKRLKNYNEVLNILLNKENRYFKNLADIFNGELEEYSKNKKNLYLEHDIENKDKFTFFELISELYYREKFHSDILFSILNKDTPDIGRDYFLKLFLEYLKIPIEVFNPEKEYTIKLEQPTGKIQKNEEDLGKKGFIDVFIYNDSQALIIENKINYAPDMENQLVRYMKYVEEELEIKKYAVIYLTLTNDKNKKPPINSYSREFNYYSEKLKNLNEKVLYECYAVGENSLSNIFLKNCLDKLKMENNSQIASVFLEQYKILLDHEGGYAYMENLEKETLESIIFDEKKEKLAEDFFDLWTNYKNGNVSPELIKNYVLSKSKIKFQEKEVHDCSVFTIKKEDYYVYWDGAFDVGYASSEKKTFSKTQQNSLEKKLSTINNIGKIQKNENWVWTSVTNKQDPYILKNLITVLNELLKA